ncbi:MAG: fibronectin type III domain-containing protein [Nitriliruptor sp.]
MGDGTAAENEVSSSQTNNDGARQYSVSGLDDDEDYVLTLFPAEDVSIDDDGVVSFDDTEGTDNAGNGEADNQGNTNAEIEVVNGSTVADGTDEVVVPPVNGTINFTIDSTVAEAVRPVLFSDEDGDDDLDLDADDQPTEDFGVGGAKTWIPAEAAAGEFDVDVTSVNKDANRFVGDGASAEDDGSYYYDSNDVFRVSNAPVTMATFEARLSTGDDVDGIYATDEDLQSTFNLTDTSPTAPENVAASATDSDTVEVTWTEPDSGEPDEYIIYRYELDEDETALDCPDATTASGLAEYEEVGRVDGDADDLEFVDEPVNDETRRAAWPDPREARPVALPARHRLGAAAHPPNSQNRRSTRLYILFKPGVAVGPHRLGSAGCSWGSCALIVTVTTAPFVRGSSSQRAGRRQVRRRHVTCSPRSYVARHRSRSAGRPAMGVREGRRHPRACTYRCAVVLASVARLIDVLFCVEGTGVLVVVEISIADVGELHYVHVVPTTAPEPPDRAMRVRASGHPRGHPRSRRPTLHASGEPGRSPACVRRAGGPPKRAPKRPPRRLHVRRLARASSTPGIVR